MTATFEFTRALVRTPSQSVTHGLRAETGEGPTHDGVAREHAAYVAALKAAGVIVDRLPALEAFPDSVFIEDPALVFADFAILLRPGAPSRFGEAATVAPALAERFDTVLTLDEGYVDGGDVLDLGDRVLIGLSARTDKIGAERLAALFARQSRRSEIVATPPGVLHFKSDCSLVDHETVLSSPRLASAGYFRGMRVIEAAADEPGAANALRVNGDLLIGKHFQRTADRLGDVSARRVALETEEMARLDAGLSCLSLRW